MAPMKSKIVYVCEICGEAYDEPSRAEVCEAKGMPDPIPWLRLGVKIPAFGEDGVTMCVVNSVHVIHHYHKGEWMTDCTTNISHNQEYEDPLRAKSFDPRQGYDAFRYEGKPEDIAIWRATMKEYGFALSEASSWVRSHVARWEQRQGLPLDPELGDVIL